MSAITKIEKRDGRIVSFNSKKICDAIYAASINADNENITQLDLPLYAEQVVQRLIDTGKLEPTVEQVQDAVEFVLRENNLSEIEELYHNYRLSRTKQREKNSSLFKTFSEINESEAIDSDIKRENANVDGNTAMGTMLKFGSEGAKHYFKTCVMDPEFAAAHDNGYIHIHDLDFYTTTTTCCQIDITKLFNGGFGTGHGAIREPQSITAYASLACIAIQSNQNDQHGGQSIPTFDYAMADGVRKSFKRHYFHNLINLMRAENYSDTDIEKAKSAEKSMGLCNIEEFKAVDAELPELAYKFALEDTERETYQAMEALVHNLNTMHSRAGAQVPFSSINYGTDTSEEGRMVIKNLLLATERGLGDGETPIFPIQIFRLKDGINTKEGDINYDLFQLACRVSSRRLFPNFSFQDAPYNLAYYKEGHPETEIAYMGCRTRVIGNRYDPNREISYSRGNLSFTSINLPRLAIENKGDIDGFYKKLAELLDLCKRQLLERLQIQMNKKVKNFPFLMGQHCWLDSETLKEDDKLGDILKHGTLSIGFIGLAETLILLVGKHHGESEDAQKLGLEIVKFMRDTVDKFGEETGLNFTLLATPAEGLSGRFTRIDKKEFGVIKEVTDKEYYTNSFHVPVYYKITAYDKINIEAPYHALTNAGHISYIEVDGDISKNPLAFEHIILAMKDAGIGYGAVNHPVDRDEICGYVGVINDVCPKCGRDTTDGKNITRIRRITGYLVQDLEHFNNAKREEEKDRVKHM